MKTIYKKVLFKDISEITDYVEIELEGFVQKLKLEKQKESVCLWYEVETNFLETKVKKVIRVIGTGHPIQDEEYKTLSYLNTLKFLDDSLVFHFYEII